jgi:predicted MarR family transcription regulator
MKLRIYAVVVTLALIAALTNPSEQHHYDRLSSAHFWVNESVVTDQQMEMRLRKGADAPSELMMQAKRAEYDRTPSLSYWNYGLASAVTAYPRYVPCPTGVRNRLLSFGLLSVVFLMDKPEALAPETKMESVAPEGRR